MDSVGIYCVGFANERWQVWPLGGTTVASFPVRQSATDDAVRRARERRRGQVIVYGPSGEVEEERHFGRPGPRRPDAPGSPAGSV